MQQVLLIGASGYVGSYLREFFENINTIRLDTCDVKPGLKKHITYNQNHLELDRIQLKKYDVVLFFAGCSSVKQGKTNPAGAIAQNLFELSALREKLQDTTYLVYASSASVYSDNSKTTSAYDFDPDELAALPTSMNVYDASKKGADILLPFLGGKSTGLRLGTVCGFSSGFRQDLVFNSMVSSAIRAESVKVSNKLNWRPLLFLEDLAGIVNELLERSKISLQSIPNVLNVASTTVTIDVLAHRIANYFNVGIEYGNDTASYNIRMNTALADSIRKPTFVSLEHQAELLRMDLLTKKSFQ